MLIDELKDIFENVNAWLKFAEGKNAALIAFNGALTVGLLRVLPNLRPMPFLLSLYERGRATATCGNL